MGTGGLSMAKISYIAKTTSSQLDSFFESEKEEKKED